MVKLKWLLRVIKTKLSSYEMLGLNLRRMQIIKKKVWDVRQ